MLSTILLGGLVGSLIGIHEVIRKDKSNNVSNEVKDTKEDYRRMTIDYCGQLSLDELHEYINSNHELNYYRYRIYNTCNINDKFYIVKHIGDLAEMLDRPFNNRHSRY